MATRSRVRAVESAGPAIFDGGNATVNESPKKALERQARIFDKRGTFVCTFNVRGCCDETKIRSVAVCFSQSPIQLVALQDTRRTSDFAKVELEGWSIFESPMEKSAHAGGILVLWRAPLPQPVSETLIAGRLVHLRFSSASFRFDFFSAYSPTAQCPLNRVCFTIFSALRLQILLTSHPV